MRSRALLMSLLLLMGFSRRETPVTLFLAGDSTMAEKQPDKRPETGWGEMLQQYFSPSDVRVSNHAMNGRSTRTFITEGRWQAIVDSVKSGDYVFIQFGHNDEAQDKSDRYTPPADYRANLIRMVAGVRAKHGTAVLLTPVRRRKFDTNGQLVDTHGEYPDIVRTVAAEQHVTLLDMHRASAEALARYGADSSRTLFLQLKPGEHPNYPNGIEDNTHFRPVGAELMARLAVEEIRGVKLELATFVIPRKR